MTCVCISFATQYLLFIPLTFSRVVLAASYATRVASHGAMVTPRARNSIDWLVGVNSPKDWPSNAGEQNPRLFIFHLIPRHAALTHAHTHTRTISSRVHQHQRRNRQSQLRDCRLPQRARVFLVQPGLLYIGCPTCDHASGRRQIDVCRRVTPLLKLA